MKRILSILFVAMLTFAFIGCEDDENALFCNGVPDNPETTDKTEWICYEGEVRCSENGQPEKCLGGQWMPQNSCPQYSYCNYGICEDAFIAFPMDESPHHDFVEWWYWTGEIFDEDGNQFGFELTFFYFLAEFGIPLWMVNVAITDLETNTHKTAVWFDYHDANYNPTELHLESEDASVDRWQDDQFILVAGAEDMSFTLALNDIKGPIYHGGVGAIRMSSRTADSFYYTRPLMEVEGVLNRGDKKKYVTGSAWMDHQWGNFNPFVLIGWDWFSVRFDDDTDLMVFIFRSDEYDPDAVDMAFGTFSDADGNQINLGSDDIHVHHIDTWESPHTGGVYPQDWVIRVPDMALEVRLDSVMEDQEVPNFIWDYWEGLTTVEGTKEGQYVTGSAFVELSGYAGRPALWFLFDQWQ